MVWDCVNVRSRLATRFGDRGGALRSHVENNQFRGGDGGAVQIERKHRWKRLAHYRILSLLGKGGMGEVFLAEDTRLHRKVALKVLLPEVAEDKEKLARFVQEARARIGAQPS